MPSITFNKPGCAGKSPASKPEINIFHEQQLPITSDLNLPLQLRYMYLMRQSSGSHALNHLAAFYHRGFKHESRA